MHSGPFQIFLSQRAELIVRHLRQHLRVMRLVVRTALAGEAARNRDQIGKFLRPIDHAVASKNLLDQRRSCARKTHDEDRVRRFAPAVRQRAYSLRREELYQRMHVAPVRICIIANSSTPHRVAAAVVQKCLVIFACILQRLAERKAGMEELFPTDILVRSDPAHGCDLVRREAIGL
jgi:hypothetical protein